MRMIWSSQRWGARSSLAVCGVALASVVALAVPSVAGAVSPTAAAPTAVSGALGSLTQAVPATASVSADGVPAPTFTLTGPSTAGLSVDANTGAITGTPSTAATYDFTVTASNAGGSSSARFTGTVASQSGPTALSSSGTVSSGNFVSISLSADGSPAPAFAVSAGSLPAGLLLNTTTGAITGQAAPGSFSVELAATNVAGSASAWFTGAVDPTSSAPTAVFGSLGSLTAGNASARSMTTDGSPEPTYSVTTGALPVGLTLNPSSGEITGMPTTTDPYSFQITATNTYGTAATTFAGTVVGATRPTAVSASLGSLTVTSAEPRSVSADGSPAPTFAVTGGVMPAGLALAANGAITGTVTTAGLYSFTATATNSSGSATATFSGRVAAAAAPTAVSGLLGSLSVGVSASATLIADGAPVPTFMVIAGALPAGLSLDGVTGAISGTPTTAGPYSVTIAAANPVGQVSISFAGIVASRIGTARLTPLAPYRLLDTRTGGGPVAGGAVRDVQVIGVVGVPADAMAAVLNVTATGPTGAGYLTVFPCGRSVPDASNLNFAQGQTIANAVTVTLGVGGKVCVYTSTTVHLIVDLDGAYNPTGAASLTPLSPLRLLDTRGRGVKVAAGTVQDVQVAGANGVTADAVAAVLNVTATGTDDGAGYVTAFPCGTGVPNVSNLNFAEGDTIPNAVTVTIGDGGRVCLFTSNAIHLIVDLNGIYTPTATASLSPLVPGRLLDTRAGGV
ncbi:MAG: hypothetical protein QOD72_229, partial [Acidimicrobiaceae bacterium]|nr:hypothetical protein [Acidimicrobiaceae bacterium]